MLGMVAGYAYSDNSDMSFSTLKKDVAIDNLKKKKKMLPSYFCSEILLVRLMLFLHFCRTMRFSLMVLRYMIYMVDKVM